MQRRLEQVIYSKLEGICLLRFFAGWGILQSVPWVVILQEIRRKDTVREAAQSMELSQMNLVRSACGCMDMEGPALVSVRF